MPAHITRQLSCRSLHISRALRQSTGGVWSDFQTRSKSLSIPSERTKQYILEGSTVTGPPSLKRKMNRVKYRSPELIDDIFQTSYQYLQERAQKAYNELQSATVEEKEKLLVKAELYNPEVQYNFQFHDKLNNNPAIIDYGEPIYRHLGRKHWESQAQMLLMQRLETLAVIPDTLPTLVPRAEVNIKFPFSTGVNKWVAPGETLSSNVTSLEPIFKIQEYETIDPTSQRYSILIVNPDTPDLKKDSYKTTLCYGLCNVKIGYNDNVVDPRKYDSSNVLVSYLPPVPEKNIGKQRFAVWVFRQDSEFTELPKDVKRENFDIRAFAKKYKLDPIGAHVWRSEWDTNVANVRELYGMAPGRVFSKTRH